MIVILVNKQYDNERTQFDGSFIENDETLLRLGGITFEGKPSYEEVETRIIEIINSNFEVLILEKIEMI
jgi:hypothetical protein